MHKSAAGLGRADGRSGGWFQKRGVSVEPPEVAAANFEIAAADLGVRARPRLVPSQIRGGQCSGDFGGELLPHGCCP